MGGLISAIFDGPPDAPDPVATANAQGAANLEAAKLTASLNRADQINPYGQQMWTVDPNNPEHWTSTTTLAPEQQALLDQQTSIATGLGDAQQSALGRVQSTFGQGLDTSGMTQRLGVGDALSQAGQNLYNPEGLTSRTEGMADMTAGLAGQAGDNFSQQLNTAMPGVSRLSPTPQYRGLGGSAPDSDADYRSQIQNALYSQQQSRLDPRFQQAESDQTAALAAQGITQGSNAYNREVQNLGMAKNDAYQSAMNQAISGGEAAINAQYGRDLSGRQQDLTQRTNDYQSMLSGRGQELGALNQYFGQEMAGRSQGLNEYNAAAGNAFQGQQGLQNAAQYSLGYGQALPAIAGQYMGLNESQRQAQLAEGVQLRGQDINELNALRTGAQVTNPQFGATNSGATVGAAPIAQSIYNGYNSEMGSYNSAMGGLASLGGAAMGAPTGTFAGW